MTKRHPNLVQRDTYHDHFFVLQGTVHFEELRQCHEPEIEGEKINHFFFFIYIFF